LIYQVRSEQRAGRPSVARVYTAGQGFVFKDGYGGLAGVTPSYSRVEEIEPVVARLAGKKVDLVKLWLDDELGALPKMPPEMTGAIIDSARKHGLRTATHIFYLEDARRVVAQGAAALADMVRDTPVVQALIAGTTKKGITHIAATRS